MPVNPSSFETPPELNLLDHRVKLRNGSTVILEMTPQRLQQAKGDGGRANLRETVEYLTKENSSLRLEIVYYRACFEAALYFRDKVYDSSQQLILLHFFEPQVDPRGNGHKQGLELGEAVDVFAREMSEAEKSWMSFWEAPDNIAREKTGWV
jgi:hypothetical protein